MQESNCRCQHCRINKAAQRLGEGSHQKQEGTGVSGAADTKGLLFHLPISGGTLLPPSCQPRVQ